MLTSSFVLLDGIGPKRESTLWRHGLETWDDFMKEPKAKGISESRKIQMDQQLAVAKEKLKEGDSSFFAKHLARKEHWRCLREFGRSVGFLDIETTGVSFTSPVTMVGIYDGARMHTMVRGINLNQQNLQAILSSVSVIVTFNGSSFDLPLIEYNFPGTVPDVLHVDLKHALRRLGLAGGLKAIEREMGIERDHRVEYMTGEDAVYLWRLWERQGKKNALDLLKEYNAADCMNLKILADFAYRSLRARSFDKAVSHPSRIE
jgi:uncharacterized protein YprB with RNaseH-like and TPR domain